MDALVGIIKGVVIGLALAGAAGAMLALLYRNNRLLFWCLTVALCGHIGVAGVLWGAGKLLSRQEKEIRIEIASFRRLPQPQEKPKPQQEFKPLDIPLGSPNGNRKVSKMPKGKNIYGKRSGPPGKKSFGGRTMVSGIGPDGDIGVDPDAKGPIWGPGDPTVDPNDIRNMTNSGGGGDWGGTPDGEGSGDVPAGFANGKIGGRVYFIRLKHGSGAWNAYDDGTRRLLNFLNQYFPCESESRAMTAQEMRERYMNKGSQPVFLYVYCDESFSLSGSDVVILRDYMDRGGFLFLDSRPDAAIKDQVAREMDKVLPGTRLAAIQNSHAINSFLFRLSSPGVGLNIMEKKNYGISKGGRLVVFYSMGNFSAMYSEFAVNAGEYVTAQYQMGANVMVYAITRGNATGIQKRQGAKASVTTAALQQLGFLEEGGPKRHSGGGDKPPESVKIKKDPPKDGSQPPVDEPDEIDVLGDHQ